MVKPRMSPAVVAGAKATSTPSAPSRPFPAPPFPGHHAQPRMPHPAGAAGSTRIWIITGADRSVTTILPPEEY